MQICQDQNGKKNEIFATSYDPYNRIPIYSAYKLDLNLIGGTSQRPDWYTENALGNRQAKDEDYRNSGYDRGHLAPNSYFATGDRVATFSLTNAVPQDQHFNRGKWRQAEQNAMNKIKNNCNNGISYFITGAITGNKPLNAGVNIPSHMYTAACCVKIGGTGTFSFGHIGLNNQNSTIDSMSIVDLGKIVQNNYIPPLKSEVEFFADNCNYNNKRQRYKPKLKKRNVKKAKKVKKVKKVKQRFRGLRKNGK